MKNEYRMFVVNNRVVATSACYRNTVPLNAWNNGRFDPRIVDGHNAKDTYVDRKRVYLYAKFANKFNKEMKEKYPKCKNYVLDVAWCEEKNTVVPIELNSITWSGAYQTNLHRLCAAISGNTFKYEDLQLFLKDKCHYWLQLIQDKKINKSMFDLCGLERTFKGNTLKILKKIITETKKNIKNVN